MSPVDMGTQPGNLDSATEKERYKQRNDVRAEQPETAGCLEMLSRSLG